MGAPKEVPLSLLDRRIATTRRRLDALGRHTGGASPPEMTDAISALTDALDELLAAGEELRQQNEELLRTRGGLELERQRYRDLFDFAPDGYLVTRTDAVIVEANQAAAALLRTPSEQLVGRPLRTFVSKAERGLFDRHLRTLRAGLPTRWRTTLLSRQIPVEVEAAPSGAESAPEDLRWLVRDMTESLRTEQALHDREEQLRQSQRIEAIGRLAGGVAHDFNNLLSVIIGHAEVSLREGATAGIPPHHTEQILEASRKAAALTQQLLTFSRTQRFSPKTVDLNTTVAGSGDILRRLIGEDITFVTELTSGICLVNADAVQIEQVVMNLCLNARDAMPQGGKLTLGTTRVAVSEEEARGHAGKAGPHVLLTVSDTGVGMSPLVQEHIFEPYFTTKEPGKGTGLGLATVYGIVRQSGGFVTVESAPGTGSTFRVLFPSVEVAPSAFPRAAVPSRSGQGDHLGGDETIMVVEDEAMVREMVCQILELAGYQVIAVSGARDALSALSARPEAVDLLLSDVVMPEMSGPQLAERVATLYPQVKAFFMSGYADGSLGAYRIPAPEAGLLEKPFTADQLLHKVREVLDAD